MKFSVLILILLGLAIALPVAAQDNGIITLDDSSPAINVVITLPPDTTGSIALNFASASITLTDGVGSTVFHAADQRLHALELNIAPNSGSHTLTVERLPGVAQAQVSVTALPELTQLVATTLVDGNTLTLNQEAALNLTPASPGGTMTVNVPQGTTGLVSATFPGASATSQLVDASGVVMAESFGGQVDSINYVVDGGDYYVTILGNGLADAVVAGVGVASALENNFTVLQVPDAQAATNEMVSNTADCSATVNVSSINLRTGPGTGYSVTGYGYRNEVFPVGGRNPENSWIVIGTDSGSAWMSLGGSDLSGACDTLAIYNIPLRNAQPAQIVVVPQQSQQVQSQQSSSYYGEHDDDHDDHDDDHGEGDHDD